MREREIVIGYLDNQSIRARWQDGHQWVERTENEPSFSTNEAVASIRGARNSKKRNRGIARFRLLFVQTAHTSLCVRWPAPLLAIAPLRARTSCTRERMRLKARRPANSSAVFSLTATLLPLLRHRLCPLSFHLTLCLWSSGSSYRAAACIVTHNFFPSSAL